MREWMSTGLSVASTEQDVGRGGGSSVGPPWGSQQEAALGQMSLLWFHSRLWAAAHSALAQDLPSAAGLGKVCLVSRLFLVVSTLLP